jgi:Protein of unknown function (DUF3558)
MSRPAPMSERRLYAAAAAALVLWMLAGCAGDAPEPLDTRQPKAGASVSVTLVPTSQPGVTATADSDQAPLATIDPCSLVSPQDEVALGLGQRSTKTVGQVRVCRWRHEGRTLRETFTVGVEMFEGWGLADLVAKNPKPGTIGGRRSVTATQAGGNCRVGLEVTESSRVDATAVGGDVGLACRLATRLAGVIEPRLP